MVIFAIWPGSERRELVLFAARKLTNILEPKKSTALSLNRILIPLYRDDNAPSDDATARVAHPVITNRKNHFREARKARRSAAC